MLSIAFSQAQRRWNTALALMAFALLLGTAACGGGSSSSSTTTSTSNPVTGNTVITGTGGSNSYPLTINVTVQ